MRALLLVVGLHLVVFGGQQALLHRKQQVEHAAGAAVAVGEGVDGFTGSGPRPCGSAGPRRVPDAGSVPRWPAARAAALRPPAGCRHVLGPRAGLGFEIGGVLISTVGLGSRAVVQRLDEGAALGSDLVLDVEDLPALQVPRSGLHLGLFAHGDRGSCAAPRRGRQASRAMR